jgi:hypothetical protein
MGVEYSPEHARMRVHDAEPVRDWHSDPQGGFDFGEPMARGHARRFWRPAEPRKPRVLVNALGALAFNLGLVVLAIAGAASSTLVLRDKLYSYDTSEASARSVRARVEKIAGEVILLDFDRRRQWDDLIAMELIAGDVGAARGFLLSARSMLSPSDSTQLARELRNNARDAEVELAALELLTPGTRNRYEATVPLLSRRSASATRLAGRGVVVGDQRDFELMADSAFAESEPNALQFVLTGLGIGLGPELTPRQTAGAAALIGASRNENYADSFDAEMSGLIDRTLPLQAFRDDARRRAGEGDPTTYATASEAFRASLDADGVGVLMTVLDEAGGIAEATSPADAAMILTHARALADVPRLRQVAGASADRAAAVAKRAPHDGRLADAAQGTLSFTRPLIERLAIAGVAGVIALLMMFITAIGAMRQEWERRFAPPAEDEHDLVDDFSSGRAF